MSITRRGFLYAVAAASVALPRFTLLENAPPQTDRRSRIVGQLRELGTYDLHSGLIIVRHDLRLKHDRFLQFGVDQPLVSPPCDTQQWLAQARQVAAEMIYQRLESERLLGLEFEPLEFPAGFVNVWDRPGWPEVFMQRAVFHG